MGVRIGAPAGRCVGKRPANTGEMVFSAVAWAVLSGAGFQASAVGAIMEQLKISKKTGMSTATRGNLTLRWGTVRVERSMLEFTVFLLLEAKRHLPSADDVDMEVKYRLASVRASIDHQAVAGLIQACLRGQLARNCHHVP